MGHTARGCKQERNLVERVEVKCVNCDQPGHRARDCTEKRKDKFACRNCKYECLVFLRLLQVSMALMLKCTQSIWPQRTRVP